MRAKRCAGLVRTASPKDEFCARVSDARLRLPRASPLRGSRAGALFDSCFEDIRVVTTPLVGQGPHAPSARLAP